MATYDDKTQMPFGLHKGKPLEKVPASYLLWWADQAAALLAYISKNRSLLEKEAEGR